LSIRIPKITTPTCGKIPKTLALERWRLVIGYTALRVCLVRSSSMYPCHFGHSPNEDTHEIPPSTRRHQSDRCALCLRKRGAMHSTSRTQVAGRMQHLHASAAPGTRPRVEQQNLMCISQTQTFLVQRGDQRTRARHVITWSYPASTSWRVRAYNALPPVRRRLRTPPHKRTSSQSKRAHVQYEHVYPCACAADAPCLAQTVVRAAPSVVPPPPHSRGKCVHSCHVHSQRARSAGPTPISRRPSRVARLASPISRRPSRIARLASPVSGSPSHAPPAVLSARTARPLAGGMPLSHAPEPCPSIGPQRIVASRWRPVPATITTR